MAYDFSTTNLYLVAHLKQLNMDYIKMERHPTKENILMFIYNPTPGLQDIIDDFHDNKELREFITNHFGILNNVKRENKR